jgi:hypothetical protein
MLAIEYSKAKANIWICGVEWSCKTKGNICVCGLIMKRFAVWVDVLTFMSAAGEN